MTNSITDVLRNLNPKLKWQTWTLTLVFLMSLSTLMYSLQFGTITAQGLSITLTSPQELKNNNYEKELCRGTATHKQPLQTSDVVGIVSRYSRETCESENNCRTAIGKKPIKGITIACPRKYQLGTRVRIQGHVYTCQDRTSTTFDGRWDIWNGYSEAEYQDALKFGVQSLPIDILK